MPEPGVRDSTFDRPTSANVARDREGKDPSDINERKGSGFKLPPGFENILLVDGRTLGDLFGSLGRGRFRGPRSGEIWARLMERRAQANRLNSTKSRLASLDGDANVRWPTLLEG